MENKKNLQVNCAACDIRNITEELLSAYDEVQINTGVLVTNSAAQTLMGRYKVQVNCASTISAGEGVRVSIINGPMTISAGQAAPEEKRIVSVNGPPALEPGCEEALKGYAAMFINGPVTCPDSMTGLLSAFEINGPVQTYPDGAILLKRTAVLDRLFLLRAKQDALYYAAKRIVALTPDINFAKLSEKNVRFKTKQLLVTESQAELAVPLFDEKADIVILPDGCAYINDNAELNENLIKRYGGKLYIVGDLTVTPDSASVLDQISYLQVSGDLRVCRGLKDRVMAMDLTYDRLRVVGGVLICDRPALELTTNLLAGAEEGLSVADCANVTIAADVTPELLKAYLVSVTDSIVFCASKEQMDVIQALAEDCAVSLLTGEEDAEEAWEDDENTVQINAASYTF